MKEQKNSEKDNAASAPTKVDGTIVDFISELRQLVDIKDQKAHLRMTADGLFVNLAYADQLVSLFQNWFERKTAGAITRSAAKCQKKLFGSPTPQQFYLVEGNSCLLGNLVNLKTKEPQRFQLPYYLGSLLDTRNYLHPKDPKLTQLAGVEIATTNAGVSFRIKVKQETLEATATFLSEFAKVFSTASRHSDRDQQEEQPSLRQTLPVLVKFLQHSRPLSPKWRLLIPAQYEHKSNINFRQNRDWIFLVDERSRLLSVYQLHGRNLFRFTWKEYVAFKQRSKSQRIGNFDLKARKSNYCGVFKQGNKIYVLPPQTLKQFIEQIFTSAKLRDSLPLRYTIGDCLRKFCSIFQGATPAAVAKPTPIKKRPEPYREQQLFTPGWIFTVNHRQIITSCLEKGSRLHSERRLKENQSQRSSRNRRRLGRRK